MIKVENIDVWGFEHAIRGMRNPMNSWGKSDSGWKIYTPEYPNLSEAEYIVGKDDLGLMKRLCKAGTEHRKYLRQIFVSMDITAPLYWWKEFDTYKFVDPDLPHIDTDSCSTMHKIHAKEFEISDFSCDRLLVPEKLETVIGWLNDYRSIYVNWDESKGYFDEWGQKLAKKDIWWQMIQLLPSSYNQKKTVTFSYETAISIIHQRSGHKLDEWRDYCDILKTLPYMEELLK